MSPTTPTSPTAPSQDLGLYNGLIPTKADLDASNEGETLDAETIIN